jgi:hypothetical protein
MWEKKPLSTTIAKMPIWNCKAKWLPQFFFMLTWLFDLAREMKVIKKAPISFGVACVIAFVVFGLVWYLVFSTTISIQSGINQAYEKKSGVDSFTNSTRPTKQMVNSPVPEATQWYLKIKSIQNIPKSLDDHPEKLPFRIEVVANSQNYSFPSTSLWLMGEFTESGESVPLPLDREKYVIQFLRQGLRPRMLLTNTNGLVPTQGGREDRFEVKTLPTVGTNEIMIPDPQTGADIGVLRIIYEIVNH